MSEAKNWTEARELLRVLAEEQGPGAMLIVANALTAAESRGFRRGVEAAANVVQWADEKAAIRALAPQPDDKERE